MLFSLAPIARSQSPDLSINWIVKENERSTSMGALFNPSNINDPDSYEARLGSDGVWVDIGGNIWALRDRYHYDFRGLMPSTEYTFYIRATGNGSAGEPVSFTATTTSAATDYDYRLCRSGGEFKLIFSGLNKPDNALHYYQLTANILNSPEDTAPTDPIGYFPDIDGTTREFSLGEFTIPAGGRLFVNLRRYLTPASIQRVSNRAQVYFHTDLFPACGGGSSSKSRRGDDDDDKSPPPTPTRVKDSLNHLPPGIQVSNWVEGAQGRRVGFDAISRADLSALA